ncbi:hypothetical protein BDZ94DRAFT_1319209 [Collybia nuda]|uniref:Small ribosomal subunit protein uS10m n=1 Tax=Collybia nuda TaxID=64659 RepID=A0A9P5YFH6_9AGAR|nr:hypothetical protein BDZ94DRAFT_1319209 [Collybia nuda]
MLRLALSRPSRIVLPSCQGWQRFNSNGAVVSPATSGIPSGSNSKLSSEPSSSKPSKVGVKPTTLTETLDSTLVDLDDGSDAFVAFKKEMEMAGVTPADLTSSIKIPEKIADTEAELFGNPTPSHTGIRHRSEPLALDPKTLPLRTPLDARNSTFTELEYASTLVHGRSIYLPPFHPRTHGYPVANIQFRSHHPRLLDLFTHFATHAAYSLGIPISRVCTLPTKRTLWTVLRSPFVHKKSQENFERRVHKRAIKAWDADPEVIDRWFRYLRRHALGGVGMRTTKWERMPLGIGRTQLEDVMDRLQAPTTPNSEKIKALGRKIVMEEMNAATQSNATDNVQKE